MASFTSVLTGGLVNPGSGGFSKKAIKQEKKRQQVLDYGTDLIDAVFYGGTTPLYSPVTDKFTKSAWQQFKTNPQTLFSLTPKGINPFVKPKSETNLTQDWSKRGAVAGSIVPIAGTGVGAGLGGVMGGLASGDWQGASMAGLTGGLSSLLGGLFDGGSPSLRDLVNKQIQKGNLFTGGEQSFEGFQPSFFDQRAKDYINFAMPQLQKQFQDNFEAIMYNMANRGLLGGSASQKAQSDLFTAAGQGRQRIADEAIGQSQQLRRDVEGARQGAIDQLYQTANPTQATQRAIATASEFRQPSTFAPIANMFSNLANQYYMNQVLNTYRGGVAPLALDYGQNPTVALNIPRNN